MKNPQIQKENNFGLGDLHPKEAGLIHMIRQVYRFGTIEIVTADGIPKQVRMREYSTNIPNDEIELNVQDMLRDRRTLLKILNALERLDEK